MRLFRSGLDGGASTETKRAATIDSRFGSRFRHLQLLSLVQAKFDRSLDAYFWAQSSLSGWHSRYFRKNIYGVRTAPECQHNFVATPLELLPALTVAHVWRQTCCQIIETRGVA